MIDLNMLEEIARSATPGPWWIDSHGHEMVNCETLELIFMTSDDMGESIRHGDTGNLSRWRNDNDATFIAAFDPTAAIALITRLREAEKDAARYRWLRNSGKFLETGDKFDSVVDQAMKEEGYE